MREECWKCISNENKGYKSMPKNGVEPEWFIYISLHVYIAYFGYMHARHLIGMHDRHLAFMQAWHLVIMR